MPWWQQLLVIVAGAALGGFLFGSIGMGIALSSIATGITAHGQGAATFVRSPGSATRSWFENLTPGELLLILGTEAAGRLIPSALSAKLGKNFYKHPNASRLANYSSDTQQRWMHRWPQEMKDAYRKQVDELAPDPDHRRSDGTYSPEGMKYDEGAIATELLWRGEFRDLIRPADAGMGDFLEPVGVKQDGRVLFQAWDIKGFRNEKPGRFTEENVIKNVQEQFDRGRNVILDTSNLSDLDQALLRQWVDQPGWAGRIFWFDWKDSS